MNWAGTEGPAGDASGRSRVSLCPMEGPAGRHRFPSAPRNLRAGRARQRLVSALPPAPSLATLAPLQLLTEGWRAGAGRAGLLGPGQQHLPRAWDSVIQLYFKCWFWFPKSCMSGSPDHLTGAPWGLGTRGQEASGKS